MSEIEARERLIVYEDLNLNIKERPNQQLIDNFEIYLKYYYHRNKPISIMFCPQCRGFFIGNSWQECLKCGDKTKIKQNNTKKWYYIAIGEKKLKTPKFLKKRRLRKFR